MAPKQVIRYCPQCSNTVRGSANFCHVCGYKLPLFYGLRQGTQIGNYIVDRFLGSGGIGAVYLSHHRLLKQSVALKIHDYFPSDQYVSWAFLRSSNYLSQLDHPNIVHLYDYGLQDGKAYQAIEYINGPTFAQLPYQRTQGWIDRCIEYFAQMLAALDYTHKCSYIDVDGTLGKGIIHGDIKPHNIFLDRMTDKVKLSDFMIPDVKAFLGEKEPNFQRLQMAQTDPVFGTPEYMSPEQKEGHISPQTDIFSLGITMYQIVTGISPTSFEGRDKLWGRVPSVDENPYVPTWLSELILKATEREPAYRFQGIAEMLWIFQEQRNQGRPYTLQVTSASPTRDQLAIGQFNNVVAWLNTTSQPELANTLKLFQQAIMASKQLSSNKKQELIEIVNRLGTEATRVVPNTTFLRIVSDGLLKALQDIPDPSLSEVVQREATMLARIYQEQKNMKRTISILFLAANPKDTSSLRLDEEIRGIDAALRGADFRDRFDIKQQWAVRSTDLQSYLLRYKPAIVHFSGHGSSASEIILEDGTGNSHPVPAYELSQVFSILKDNIRCVVLNACYSQQQAQAIAEHIDCVIGMSRAISDAAAVSFAVSFYQALAYGRNVKTAFGLGCSQIALDHLNEQDTPQLLTKTADPTKITFVNTST